ncbi:MAG TPA: M24 family metallopeptidase [Thermoleophilaceae bacterium]|jgi:Xaa-Pro aminopeptidase|nr:M24 family metallopeptidase [Thermoleophilaceae bacterium]
MARRAAALDAAMAERDVEHLVIYGANRFGSAVGWLTRWPVTREAVVVHTPGERDVLLVNFYNHVPNAQRIATETDVRWAGERPAISATEELERRRGRGRRIGVIGSLSYGAHVTLEALASEVVDMNASYTRRRLVKSPEEIAWIRIAAQMTDDAIRELHATAIPGTDERELGDIVERAYTARGGTTHIHYFGATSMDAPALSVPAQWPSTRRLERGDVLTCEISAAFWEYSAQLLRTFTVAAEPTAQYRDLHDVADAAFHAIVARLRPGAAAADLVAASQVIEDAGFTIRDDLVHGFVGGYLPPVLGSSSRTLTDVPDFTFEAGMTVVVQPNVVTPDETAGVQTGELMLVTGDGAESLHHYPRGLLRVA